MWAEQQLKKKLNRVLRRDDTGLSLVLHTWQKLSGWCSSQHTQNTTLPGWGIASCASSSLLLAKAIKLQVTDQGVRAHQATPNAIRQKHLI